MNPTPPTPLTRGLAIGFTVALLIVAGCGEKAPIRLGFLGGTSGRVADLGLSARNGVLLAVDELNLSGGIGGRKVEIVVRDDEQNAELAVSRFDELAKAGVTAVIGPMTSSMCVAVLPRVDALALTTVSPTCTADELGGRDDHFFRILASAREYAANSARFHHGAGARRLAVIHDDGNRVYSQAWSKNLRETFEALGGTVVFDRAFTSGDQAKLGAVAADAADAAPDVVVLVANSVDAALLTQHLRKHLADTRLATSEWAATERFVELAGAAAEGTFAPQFFDRNSTAPKYTAFRDAFRRRFGEDPGFAAIAAHDAAGVVFEALRQRPGTPLKEAILAIGGFTGNQAPFSFTATGDAARATFFTVVRNGRFVPLAKN